MSYLKQEKWLKCGMCSRELKECNRLQSSFDAVNGATVLLISALHALNNKRHAVLVKANIMKKRCNRECYIYTRFSYCSIVPLPIERKRGCSASMEFLISFTAGWSDAKN